MLIMLMVSFGRWSNAASRRFSMERIYNKEHKWTPFVKIRLRKKENIIANMITMRDVQGWDGTWNHDPYMHGLYNGMEFMVAMAEGREPVYKEAPEHWLCDDHTEHKPTVSRMV